MDGMLRSHGWREQCMYKDGRYAAKPWMARAVYVKDTIVEDTHNVWMWCIRARQEHLAEERRGGLDAESII